MNNKEAGEDSPALMYIHPKRRRGDLSILRESCRLCGHNARRIDKPEEPVYFLCHNCDLIFVGSNFFIESEEEFIRYKKHNNNIEDQGYVRFLNDFINTANINKLKNVEKALDFGCGPNPVLKILLGRMGISTDIYDPFFFPDKIFANKKYDLITCTEVFEHLKAPYQTIELLKSLLAPKGILAVRTLFHTASPDFSSWWYRQDRTHVCFYSPKTFEWIGKNFGLIIKNWDEHSVCVLENKGSRL